MSSVNIISYFSLALNTEILLSRFFAPCYLFFVCSHIRVENTNKKGVHLSLFIAKVRQRDNFGLKQSLCARGLWRILRQMPFEPGKIIKIALKSIRTTKGAIITSFQATGEN